jgi:hypothetical protein
MKLCRFVPSDAGSSATAMAPMLPPAPPSPDDGRLAAIVVKGPNQTVFDLSSQFQPDVAEYGVMVPQSFETATLCVMPLQGI